EEEEGHQLVYRGANYEPTTPTVEIAEGEIAGKYRGQLWRAHNPVKAPPVSQPTLNIKYRGAGVTEQNPPTSVVKTSAIEEAEGIPHVVLEPHSR
ncbi:MAG: DUF4278 domain-containing protein, partial [Coleofasciculus sp. S288]|nr:DUF4278 domain-containing protein [Coleofasciculus sp. S288]